ncbi:MAG TPA: hypothetical protein VEG42_00050, partial [Thermoplasmata archaeon]|nr:hypothetical protein [Thermoplasmata archaeon]
MFSRKEREFLRAAARLDIASLDARLLAEFPNPTYRRKLMWGIRRKASRSLSDWELYLEASQRDPRLLPRESGRG